MLFGDVLYQAILMKMRFLSLYSHSWRCLDIRESQNISSLSAFVGLTCARLLSVRQQALTPVTSNSKTWCLTMPRNVFPTVFLCVYVSNMIFFAPPHSSVTLA